MSITQLRSMLSNDVWEHFIESVKESCGSLYVLYELHEDQLEEIPDLLEALRTLERYCERIDSEPSNNDDDEFDLSVIKEIIDSVITDDNCEDR